MQQSWKHTHTHTHTARTIASLSEEILIYPLLCRLLLEATFTGMQAENTQTHTAVYQTKTAGCMPSTKCQNILLQNLTVTVNSNTGGKSSMFNVFKPILLECSTRENQCLAEKEAEISLLQREMSHSLIPSSEDAPKPYFISTRDYLSPEAQQ